MARIIKLKNASGVDKTWVGQTIINGEYVQIIESDAHLWHEDSDVFVSIGNGELIVNNGSEDITDTIESWNWLLGSTLPISDIDDFKLAVHTSYKPKSNKTTYAVWAGSGDDMTSSPHGLGDGPILDFHMEPQIGSPYEMQIVEIHVEFDPIFGKIWLHEGYLKFTNGGSGDYINAEVVARATPLQTVANKIVYIENNWVKYAIGSPTNATHGWGGTPVLIPRSYSNDGDWDYDGITLTPNFTGTGGYKISDISQTVHRYFNKVPCCGISPYFSMTSDETTELPEGYFIKITAHNISNTTWDASILIEIYRERTILP